MLTEKKFRFAVQMRYNGPFVSGIGWEKQVERMVSTREIHATRTGLGSKKDQRIVRSTEEKWISPIQASAMSTSHNIVSEPERYATVLSVILRG